MRAGILRDRVKIERPVRALDDVGSAETTWQHVGYRSAQIMALRGNESFTMGTDIAEADYRIRMRDPELGARIDPSWRLIDADRGDEYNIISIVPTRLRNDLTILVKRGGARRSA